MPLTTRPARLDDAAAIALIYSQGIEDRVATFETEPRSAGDVRCLLEARLGTYPAVVVERDGEVIGFAWVGPYSDRPCYAGVGEFSVYVRRDVRGGGTGGLVLDALLTACERAGFWKVVSKVFLDNAVSRGLCAKHGFREVGIHRRHARLDGEWRDVVVVEHLLGDTGDQVQQVALGRPPGYPTPPPGRAEP